MDSLRNRDAAANGDDAVDAAAAVGGDGPKQPPTAGANSTAAAASRLGVPLSAEQLAFDTAAGSAWVQLHIAVLNVLVQDVFTAVSNAVFDTENMRAAAMKELRAATPVVDETTWPEAARRLLAATATATFLAQVRLVLSGIVWHQVLACFLCVCRWLWVPFHDDYNADKDASAEATSALHSVVLLPAAANHNHLSALVLLLCCRESPRAAQQAAVRVSWICQGSCAAWRCRTGHSTWQEA